MCIIKNLLGLVFVKLGRVMNVIPPLNVWKGSSHSSGEHCQWQLEGSTCQLVPLRLPGLVRVTGQRGDGSSGPSHHQLEVNNTSWGSCWIGIG